MTVNAAGYTYQWVNCTQGNSPIPGANGQSYTPTTNGQYAVIITAANGCMSLSDCTTITTAGLKNELAANWKVAPNPTSGKVTVSTDAVANTSIVVTSAMGQVVTELQMNETSLTVDLSAQPTGIYFIKIGTTEVVKIVKF